MLSKEKREKGVHKMRSIPRTRIRIFVLVAVCYFDAPGCGIGSCGTNAFQVLPIPATSFCAQHRERLCCPSYIRVCKCLSTSVYVSKSLPFFRSPSTKSLRAARDDESTIIDVNITSSSMGDDFDADVDGAEQINNVATKRAATTILKNDKKDDNKEHKEHPLRDLGQAYPFSTYSARFLADNDLDLVHDKDGTVTARPRNYVPPDHDDIDSHDNDDKPVVHEIEDVGVEVEEMNYDEAVFQRLFDLDEQVDTIKQPVKKKRTFPKFRKNRSVVKEHPAHPVPKTGFNVVLTHCTADFDSLASAVGLAKLWSSQSKLEPESVDKANFDSSSDFPTFVVLPRGAHPSVQRFLALHKHLFPIRSLRSLPSDLSGLNRLGLVDAQRRDRIGPAENLLKYAKRVTVVDHHIDSDSDIPEATDYVVDKVGSVSTLIAERLMDAELDEGLSEAEATLLALGIHADTGSLCYDSTTPRDAVALAWVMKQGASQAAIAEHAQASLSSEQQGVLTQALINTNSTKIHGVTVSTVLLTADGFINGLAAVTQDALELSSSDVYLLGLVYEAKSGKSRKGASKKQNDNFKSRLLQDSQRLSLLQQRRQRQQEIIPDESAVLLEAKADEEMLLRKRLRTAFDRHDTNNSNSLEEREIATALATSGIIVTDANMKELMKVMDTNGDGKVDFDEFVNFAKDAQELQHGTSGQTAIEEQTEPELEPEKRPCTLIIIGRVKAGVNMKSVKLGKLLEAFGGGGHAKAASATVRLSDASEAADVMDGLVRDLVQNSLQEQPTVGDFMTAPVLSVRPDMTEVQVEDLFVRYDVRALPVVDDDNNVIGLVTYKEVAAAKERLWNKEQKRMRQEAQRRKRQQEKKSDDGNNDNDDNNGDDMFERKPQTAAELAKAQRLAEERRKLGSSVKGWMKQHIQTVEKSCTMAEVESILLETDVGCIPVVADGTKKLLGMVSRTDLLRQHRYYPSLHYHNKGFSDSIAARKPIIELRKKLKRFDLDD